MDFRAVAAHGEMDTGSYAARGCGKFGAAVRDSRKNLIDSWFGDASKLSNEMELSNFCARSFVMVGNALDRSAMIADVFMT